MLATSFRGLQSRQRSKQLDEVSALLKAFAFVDEADALAFALVHHPDKKAQQCVQCVNADLLSNTAPSSHPGVHKPRGNLLIATQFVEQVVDLMHDTAFFIKDASGRYLVVNQSLVERHGLTDKSQMIGKRPCDVCPGDFGRIPTEQDAQVLRTGKPIIERLELFWRRPHVPVWGLTSKLPIRDETGRVTGLIGISKDLTALVNREEVPPAVALALRHLERPFY